MADQIWHTSDDFCEAHLEVDDDGRLELSANDVDCAAEGAGVVVTTEAAVQLRNALTDWLYRTTGHGWLEAADRG